MKKMLVILLAVVINYAGSALAGFIAFPLYLDSLMTIGITASFGLWAGLACAVLSNLALTVFSSAALPFMLCHVGTVFVAWGVFTFYQKNCQCERMPFKAFLWAGLFAALLNAVLGNLISVAIEATNSVRSARPQADSIVQGMYIATHNLVVATYVGGTIENLIDKSLSGVVSYLAYTLYHECSSR